MTDSTRIRRRKERKEGVEKNPTPENCATRIASSVALSLDASEDTIVRSFWPPENATQVIKGCVHTFSFLLLFLFVEDGLAPNSNRL